MVRQSIAVVRAAMERTGDPQLRSKKSSAAWLPEIDQILIVGMKHGPRGIREATNRVIALRAGLTRADCWKRLRFLRENSNGNYPAPRNWPQEIKDLLRDGYQEGGQKKRQAIKAVKELYPGLPSNTPSRFARRQGWLKHSAADHQTRPWTHQEEQKLWELAGYEPAAKIGERLGRSEGAVRFRLKLLGLSVKVKDGWSLRGLQELLHLGPSRLRRFVADGSLRVRNPSIWASSLAQLWERRVTSMTSSPQDQDLEALRQKLRKGPKAYSWGRAARLLRVSLEQVRIWIAKGELKIVDGFVTERAFQDFCRKCGPVLNRPLLGEEVRDWLVDGYALPVSGELNRGSVQPSEKHALVTRQCPRCARRIRGNGFFTHFRSCKGAMSEGKVEPAHAPGAQL